MKTEIRLFSTTRADAQQVPRSIIPSVLVARLEIEHERDFTPEEFRDALFTAANAASIDLYHVHYDESSANGKGTGSDKLMAFQCYLDIDTLRRLVEKIPRGQLLEVLVLTPSLIPHSVRTKPVGRRVSQYLTRDFGSIFNFKLGVIQNDESHLLRRRSLRESNRLCTPRCTLL